MACGGKGSMREDMGEMQALHMDKEKLMVMPMAGRSVSMTDGTG